MTNAAGDSSSSPLDRIDKDLRETIGYLNFSNGKEDVAFEGNFNRVYGQFIQVRPYAEFPDFLSEKHQELRAESDVFADSSQFERIVPFVFEQAIPAYREHHADLLFHLPHQAFYHPLFVAKVFEAALNQGGPWEDRDRILQGTLDQINDFLGFRPIAVLENDRRIEPYAHERHRPVPIFIRGAGVAFGPFQELIEHTLEFFRDSPTEIHRDAYFDLDRMEELAIDMRAHDHMHPVNKRTNYMFGEWDPHLIDNKGFYYRFVVRQMILDALQSWMDSNTDLPREEVLYDASAVLCGTMLMASSISGCGPDSHGGEVTLTSLLPTVARQRDAFYSRLLDLATGARRKRLQQVAQQTQQPFGHVRQHLNMHLARYGARQVQHRHLAHLYGRMGFSDASRQEAAVIPSSSARFECEIQWRLTAGEIGLKRGTLETAIEFLSEIKDLFDRGVQCGAIVDPWNVLGFQAQFPLFSSREDSVPDHRIEVLLDLMEQWFGLFAHAMCEAARQGRTQDLQTLSSGFQELADQWDQYATTTIEDLPSVRGHESWESAKQVAQAMTEWREAGEAAGDISFWRSRVGTFQSVKAYAQITEALLQAHDHVASMGLLMQWLSEADSVGLEAGPYSIHMQIVSWLRMAVGTVSEPSPVPVDERWQVVRRLFDYLEANAGEFWSVPAFQSIVGGTPASSQEPPVEPDMSGLDEAEDDEDNLFDAAYEGVVYRDSADDGFSGETLDDSFMPGNTEFEILNRQLEPRLRFLATTAHLWQMAAACFSAFYPDGAGEEQIAVVQEWRRRTSRLRAQLSQLLKDIWRYEISISTGDLDANVEYDVQLQTKFYMLHTTISTYIGFQVAERALGACAGISGEDDDDLAAVYRGVFQRDPEIVREHLSGMLLTLGERPLLYVPFDNGGDPHKVMVARDSQTLIRFLLEQLPHLGLIQETLQVLKHAYQMERSSRPGGLAVTEFDRLFRAGLRETLHCVIRSAESWEEPITDQELVEIIGIVVDQFRRQWLQHSKTMRLSTVEELNDVVLAEGIQEFISVYGGDLFHAKLLTLGNVRAILHNGLGAFLEYLDENSGPLHPIALTEDLEQGVIDEDTAIEHLELVYETVVEKFDRFLEYNTTTTQSDYGEQFYSLLDFLRLEAQYDRDSWNLAPDRIAHQILASSQFTTAAQIWENQFQTKTQKLAKKHVAELQGLEKKYGMQLPSISDHINERFVKPMVVNRMSALIPRTQEDARSGREESATFAELRREVQAYLDSTSGSGIDVPPWLRILEREVSRAESPDVLPEHEASLPAILPSKQLSRDQLLDLIATWSGGSASRRGVKRKVPKSGGGVKRKDGKKGPSK